jgi:hypothetical protein
MRAERRVPHPAIPDAAATTVPAAPRRPAALTTMEVCLTRTPPVTNFTANSFVGV